MTRKSPAFTLIELMVVVAIIAILATLSVSNFSSATKRTRNSQRVSDIQAVAKALESCYDVAYGRYVAVGESDSQYQAANAQSITTAVGSSAFAKAKNGCLNNDILPANSNYPYSWTFVKASASGSAHFAACAKLEKVAGWGSVANSTKALEQGDWNLNTGWTLPNPSSTCTDNAAEGAACYFCAVNQQ